MHESTSCDESYGGMIPFHWGGEVMVKLGCAVWGLQTFHLGFPSIAVSRL